MGGLFYGNAISRIQKITKTMRMHPLCQLLIMSLMFSCQEHPYVKSQPYDTLIAIPPPAGYVRIKVAQGSFGEWLRKVPLKKDNYVYLYDGSLKRNQSAQFAVMDITVGKKDLQQCADAVMRLRAEYLFSQRRYYEIEFRDNNNKSYKWTRGNDRSAFARYLEQVFGWCGSASLSKQLKEVSNIRDIQPGDVFIKGGFPGHAMIVTDVAINKDGNKVFMLAQSYMPAQDIHIVVNPSADKTTCWYNADDSPGIITPEWTFYPDQLKRW
jgi:hypothetical protein